MAVALPVGVPMPTDICTPTIARHDCANTDEKRSFVAWRHRHDRPVGYVGLHYCRGSHDRLLDCNDAGIRLGGPIRPSLLDLSAALK